MRIPFKKTYYDEAEVQCVREALGGVDYTARVRDRLTTEFGAPVFLTTGASSALDLLFEVLAMDEGEVILPSFTFPSAANTVLRYGHKPVFAEVDEETGAISIDDLKRKMTSKTRCVIPTHYGGSSADMDELTRLCEDVFVIEDAALSYGAKYKKRPLGSMGDFGILSFHETKNVSAGGGGALIVNTDDEEVLQRVQTIYENGTNKQMFIKGEVDAYTWQMRGTSAALPNVNAAVLQAQLEKADEIKQKQRAVYEYYISRFRGTDGLSVPVVPEYNDDNYHVFYLRFSDFETRQRVRLELEEKGISAHFHYMPLHSSAMGQSLGYNPEDLPDTMRFAESLLRLPIYASLTLDECAAVADAVQEAL